MKNTTFLISILLGLLLIGGSLTGCVHGSKLSDMDDAPESCRLKVEIPKDKKASSDDPIMQAIFDEDSKKLKELISSSPKENIQKKDALGFSYLHLAAGVGNPELIEILIQAGVPVNGKAGKKQSTPAHSAVSWSKVTSLQALYQNGADFNIVNVDGKTPATLATEFNHSKVLKFFDSVKKQPNQ